MLVHDYLLVNRGAERSFTAMAELWPGAPVATLLYDEEIFGERLAGRAITTSPLQHLRARQGSFKALLPLLPYAAERLPVAGHELVISSSSAFVHGVRPDPGAVHVCYCYTPFRYAWYEQDAGVQQVPRAARPFVRRSLRAIQRWDHAAAQRDTRYVAISALSQQRIRRFWGVDAEIVHPPVELQRFRPGAAEDFLLLVGELVRHKHADVALEAARRSGHPIKVVGGGADAARLRHEYAAGAEFLGRVDDAELAELYRRCRALVVPNVEEFGITAVEAQAAGRPVVAADGGGARETVRAGQTGYFFAPGDVAGLTRILCSQALDDLSTADAVASAQRFSPESFKAGITQQVQLAGEAARRPAPRAATTHPAAPEVLYAAG